MAERSKKEIKLNDVKLVIWDWYRTLSNRHLYEDLQKSHPGAYEVIQNYFIDNQDRISNWAQGQITYSEMHEEFSRITGVKKEVFDDVLSTLAGKFDVDKRILPFVKKFKDAGIKQVIATDNFDVWDEFFLPQYSQYLDKYFDASYNSSKFRILKTSQANQFIKMILIDQKIDIERTLLIDDNDSFCNAFQKSGGKAINHDGIEDLQSILNEIE